MIKLAYDLLPGEEIFEKGLRVTIESVLNQHGGQTIIHHSDGRLIRNPRTKMLVADRADDIIDEIENMVGK